MLSKLKFWTVNKTIQYAESRFSIFVWMRQINDRIQRLEENKGEEAVQQRAELEMHLIDKLQGVEAMVDKLNHDFEGLQVILMRVRAAESEKPE